MTARSSRSKADLSELGNIFSYVNNILPIVIEQQEPVVPEPFVDPDLNLTNDEIMTNEAGNMNEIDALNDAVDQAVPDGANAQQVAPHLVDERGIARLLQELNIN